MKIPATIVRGRWIILAAWLAGAVALALWAPQADPAANEQTSFLPEWTQCRRAAAALAEGFPGRSGLSEAVIVFERTGEPLTSEDSVAIQRVAARLAQPSAHVSAHELIGVTVRSPGDIPFGDNPLRSEVSDRGQAALVIANVPANFITLRAYHIVDHLRAAIAEVKLPDGLSAAVTGSAGFGHDYADAAEASHARTLYATLAAVVIILLAVYRSPVAALVPLGAISMAAFVAVKVLAIGQYVGMHVGTAEHIFVIVLLYGAGTDYSLFLISRYRELFGEGLAPRAAAGRALGATLPAILASAGTDAAGLAMLCFADYGIFRTTGPAVAVALLVALLAAITLVPALVAIAGGRLFWPVRAARPTAAVGMGRKRLWPGVARVVTARPGIVLAVAVVLLAIPAVRGAHLRWVYDTLTELPATQREGAGNAAAGVQAARRHWPVGQIAPVQMAVCSEKPLTEGQWRELAAALDEKLLALPGVGGVRSLDRPLGKPLDGLGGALLDAAAGDTIRHEYVSDDGCATRLAVILDSPPFSLAAMDTLRRVGEAARQQLAAAGVAGEVLLGGATAEMADMRQVTRADFHRVAVLSLAVIFLIVAVLLRDVLLTAFMVASTVASYFATLGISYWVFAGMLGGAGLDWKVEVFLFVVMVAVGVDYNIFLASRVAQEARHMPARLAVSRAVIHTGPVISSCGLIMAATLGSLMAGELQLLRQLGFALALGMLLDTFVVRPLLLPAFVALTGRTGRAIDLGH